MSGIYAESPRPPLTDVRTLVPASSVVKAWKCEGMNDKNWADTLHTGGRKVKKIADSQRQTLELQTKCGCALERRFRRVFNLGNEMRLGLDQRPMIAGGRRQPEGAVRRTWHHHEGIAAKKDVAVQG